MNPFQKMHGKIASSPLYDQIQKFILPLKEEFGISHFWYYRITYSGLYSYVGTHTAWDEYCFDHTLIENFHCLRHPKILPSGIDLMKPGTDSNYKQVLDTAWNKFQINFNLNLLKHTPEGVEAFGFGTHFNDSRADERLLNELPLLGLFTKIFKERHRKLFPLLEENQVDLPSHFGHLFYERPKSYLPSSERKALLRKLGLGSLLALTPREREVLKFVSNGYPASHIASQLELSIRTVENHLANIKEKLSCRSKVELIDKTQEIASIGYLI